MQLDDDEDEYHRYRYRDPSAPRNQNKPPSIWFSKRFFVTLLLFLGYFLHGIICQAPGITITAMTSNKTVVLENQTIIQPAEFDWDSKAVEMILNTFWTGFLFSMVGGFLAQKCGGSTILGVSMMLTGVIISLNPISAKTHLYIFLLSQGLTGLLQSFCIVSSADIFARWMPKKERAGLMACVISGMYVGAAIVHPFCSNLAHKWEWSMNYYVTGIVCFVWSIIWLIFVRNEPLKDKQISEKELIYILQETGTIVKKRDIKPFQDILASPPCWALFTGKYTLGWASTFALTYLPLSYMKDLIQNRKDMNEEYVLWFIPNVVSFSIILFAGLQIDFGQGTSQLKPTQIHKIIIGASFTIAAIFFIIFAQFTDHFVLSIVCFVIIRSILSYNQVIIEMITVNVAPNHSSLLSGVTLFWQTVGTIFVQTVIRFTVQNHKLEDWNVCFYSSAATLILSVVAFAWLGSSEPQPWSTIRHRNKGENQRSQGRELIMISHNNS